MQTPFRFLWSVFAVVGLLAGTVACDSSDSDSSSTADTATETTATSGADAAATTVPSDRTSATSSPATVATTADPAPTADGETTSPSTAAPSGAVGQAAMDRIVDECDVPEQSLQDGQIVLNSGLAPPRQQYDIYQIFAANCVFEMVSPAGQALLGAASGATGPQQVTEDGLTFTQIYNDASSIEIMTVQLAD